MQRCAFCQGELDPATRICRACGRVQPIGDDDITLVPSRKAKGALTRHCPNCHALLPASARFCGRCGQTLVPLAEEAAGRTLHDTNTPPAIKTRDEAITDVLNRPARLADMTEAPPASPPASSASPRKGIDTRQGPGGVAHGLRYRLLSRMQARILVAALVMFFVIGGAAYSQAGFNALSPHVTSATPTTNPIPTATPTSGSITPGVTPTPSSGTGGSASLRTSAAQLVLLGSIIAILLTLALLLILFLRRLRAASR
jgi:hypothetical protein